MNKAEFSILNNVTELHRLNAFVEDLAEKWELSMKLSMNINLVLEEIVTNIIFYGFDDDGKHQIMLAFSRDDHGIEIIVSDDGNPFNILEVNDFKDEEKSAEERDIGGLGIHFVKALMDRITYERVDDKNILTLYKNTEINPNIQ
jgi:serine/threonine-protein kinase RsbW